MKFCVNPDNRIMSATGGQGIYHIKKRFKDHGAAYYNRGVDLV
jgi:hypothetical protein